MSNDLSTRDRLNDLVAKYGLPLMIGGNVCIVLGIALQIVALGAVGGVAIIAVVVSMLLIASGSQRLPAVPLSTTPVSDQVRRERLQQYLSQELMQRRGRIESATDYTAVVVHGKPVNHILHLLLSVVLCGLWLPIWLGITIDGRERRRVLSVDACGNVTSN